MPRLNPEQAEMVDSHARSDSVVASTTPGNIAKSLFVARTARILDLRERAEQAARERDEARADRKVLAAEVLASRQRCTARKAIRVMEPGARCGYGHPCDPMMAGQKCPVCAALEATDASGALTRGGGE